MTAGMIGLLIGLFFGVASWRAMNLLSQRVEKDETKRLLRIVGGVELVLMPAIGCAIGELMFGGLSEGSVI